ncbi:MAG TPA: nodulation protein NfeD [Solirubrobacterales bacterium]|nr:nodulation protein NfeD [Solirubrobacterales bacterium]
MRSRVQLALWCLVAGALLAPGALQAQSSNTVPSIELQTTIDPASAKWISSALDDAADDGAPLAIIRIDTPGGLDESMREIVKDIIDAPMPVVVYVSPDGARAASAGAFITQAGDVAAMAPQTNIGAASAVTATGGDIGGTLGEKVENDAAAYIRALAESHGRDGALPARMVTDAESVTASEALDQRAIDVIAASEDELLTELDGIRVKGPKATILHTAGLEISERDTPLQYELLSLLVNPTVAYLLLLVGLVGLGIEVFSPGLIFPGTLGLVSLLLGAYGTAQLPVTAAGIALLVVGIGLIIAEAHLPTNGVLGAVGVLALALSGLLLFDSGSDAFEVSAPVVIVVALLLGGALAFAVQKVVAARHRPVMTGWEEMVGAVGEVRQPLVPAGQVFVDGALWRAVPAEGAPAGEVERVSRRGARVRVEAVEGLTLRVRPLEREAEPVEGAS